MMPSSLSGSSSSSSSSSVSYYYYYLNSTRLQSILWYLPYLNILWVGMYLMIVSGVFGVGGTDNVKNDIISYVFGFIMIVLLGLYRRGCIGNHHVKIYCFLIMLVYMGVYFVDVLYNVISITLESSSSSSTLKEVLWERTKQFHIFPIIILWWIPQIGNIVYVLVVPSINEILPQRLYLGNLAAAQSPKLLKALGITHILELHDTQKKNNAATIHELGIDLLQLCVSDFIGSEQTLLKVAPTGLQYMKQVLSCQANRLLVHCAAGGSRSPAMIVLYLLESGKQSSLQAAVQFVQERRPFVDISTDHLHSIQQQQQYDHHEDDNQRKQSQSQQQGKKKK